MKIGLHCIVLAKNQEAMRFDAQTGDAMLTRAIYVAGVSSTSEITLRNSA